KRSLSHGSCDKLMILVLLVLVVAMLLGGLVLSIRSKGWVRLFAVLLLAVALSPVGLWVWWEYWGNEVLLTASPGKIVSITSDTGQTVHVASGTRAHPISLNDGSVALTEAIIWSESGLQKAN